MTDGYAHCADGDYFSQQTWPKTEATKDDRVRVNLSPEAVEKLRAMGRSASWDTDKPVNADGFGQRQFTGDPAGPPPEATIIPQTNAEGGQ